MKISTKFNSIFVSIQNATVCLLKKWTSKFKPLYLLNDVSCFDESCTICGLNPPLQILHISWKIIRFRRYKIILRGFFFLTLPQYNRDHHKSLEGLQRAEYKPIVHQCMCIDMISKRMSRRCTNKMYQCRSVAILISSGHVTRAAWRQCALIQAGLQSSAYIIHRPTIIDRSINHCKWLLSWRPIYVYGTLLMNDRVSTMFWSSSLSLSLSLSVCCWCFQLRSYGASPAIQDHTVLPATRHRWTCSALTAASQAGRHSIYPPRRDGRLSWPRWLVVYRDGLPVRRQSPIQVVTARWRSDRESNPRPLDRKSNVQSRSNPLYC